MCKISVIVRNASSQVMECDFLLEPCCALILLYAYPAVRFFFYALALLCHYFFTHLPCCALPFFAHLPCCALTRIFLRKGAFPSLHVIMPSWTRKGTE